VITFLHKDKVIQPSAPKSIRSDRNIQQTDMIKIFCQF